MAKHKPTITTDQLWFLLKLVRLPASEGLSRFAARGFFEAFDMYDAEDRLQFDTHTDTVPVYKALNLVCEHLVGEVAPLIDESDPEKALWEVLTFMEKRLRKAERE